MMNQKKYLIILSASLVLLGAVIALYFILPKATLEKVTKKSDEYIYYADIFNFTLSDDESYYAITSLKERHQKDQNITIPKSIDNIPVKKWIGDQGNFTSWRYIKQVDIPETIEYIGDSMEDEGILHGGTYGNKIMICEGSELVSFNVNKDNPVYRSVDGVLFSKDLSVLIRYPNAKVGDQPNLWYNISSDVKEVYDYAFYRNTKLNRVTLGENVEKINSFAFCECINLKNVDLNNKVTEIGQLAFKETGLIRIDLPNTIESLGVRAFGSNEDLEYVYIPSSIKSIKENCFSICKLLKVYTESENIEYLKSLYSWKNIEILPVE